MKSLYFLQTMVLLPILALSFAVRSFWAGIMAIVAGWGMTAAGDEGSGTGEINGKNTSEMVKCYHRVLVSSNLMKDARWTDSKLLNSWAAAERDVLKCLMLADNGRDLLESKVKIALEAGANAQHVVGQGLLSEEGYSLARQVLDEWHADLMTTYGGVKCYDRSAMPPSITDPASRLSALASLKKEGKLSSEAITEAEEGMKTSLLSTVSSQTSQEVTDLLMDLLGYR